MCTVCNRYEARHPERDDPSCVLGRYREMTYQLRRIMKLSTAMPTDAWPEGHVSVEDIQEVIDLFAEEE